jgi:predicted esterase
MMEENYIQSVKTARYYSLGKLDEATKSIWVVLHGYGQLASYFIRNFESITPNHFVIAPEGFHRFYLNGFSGRVGASWMTKEDRLNDIHDYVQYLDQVIQVAVPEKYSHLPVHVVGFSQGGATASRWLTMGSTNIRHLVLWASVFPPDLDIKACLTKLNDTKTTLVVGNQDEFISALQLKEMVEDLNNKKIPFQLLQFEGKHIIHQETLRQIADEYSVK